MTYPCVLCAFALTPTEIQTCAACARSRIVTSETVSGANPRRSLTHSLDSTEEGLAMEATRCTIEDCGRPQYARGWCNMHYQRWRDHGDPTRARPSAAERLAAGLVRVESGCLEWTGYHGPRGYGRIKSGSRWVRTHRLAWSLAHPGEPLPPEVRHTCDNPPCCEPTHLLAGTGLDNARDCVERSRQATKVSTEQVAAIRAEYAAGHTTQAALGARYGIHPSQVSRIVNRVFRVVT